MNSRPYITQSCLQDESGLIGHAGEICFPETPEETAEAFSYAAQKHWKVTIQGANTGLAGGAVPMGGLILNLGRMTELGKPQKQADGSMEITAGAGVSLRELRQQAAAYVFPPDPTEETASLGGIFAGNASGPHGLFYGPASHYAVGLTWVTPGGEIWKLKRGDYVSCGGRLPIPSGMTIPCAGAVDLVDFLSGWGGRMGAAVSVTWKLLPKPQDHWGLVFFFESQAQMFWFSEGLRALRKEDDPAQITAAEFFDEGALEILREHSHHPILKGMGTLPGKTAVFLEAEGPEASTVSVLEELLQLFEACGGREKMSWAENTPAGIELFRHLRHGLTTILGEMTEPGENRCDADFQGPEEEFPECLQYLQEVFRGKGLRSAVYGHLLTNSLHGVMLPKTREEQEKAWECMEKIFAFSARKQGSMGREYGKGRLYGELYKAYFPEENRKEQEILRILDPEELCGI